MSDAIVLSYHNCVLRENDILLLEEPNWVNDNILSFYFEFLENNLDEKLKDQILFVCPQVTQCLKIVDLPEMSNFLEPSVAQSKNLIFFALNDHRAPSQSGGLHWSLLVYSKPDNTLYHFDSRSGLNHRVAAKFSMTLIPHISVTGLADFEEVDCLQQSNGYDCGIFVLAHTDHILDYFLSAKCIRSIGKLDQSEVDSKRNRIRNLIYGLQAKK